MTDFVCSLGLLKWVACLAMRMKIETHDMAAHAPERHMLNWRKDKLPTKGSGASKSGQWASRL